MLGISTIIGSCLESIGITMIRVLHFVSIPAKWSGVMSVIMNYYRYIDRSKIQFDFLCFLKCSDSYEEEINKMGGRIFFIPKPSLNMETWNSLNSFFADHARDYQWLHNHEIYMSFPLYKMTQQYNIKNFAIHCHATRYSDSWRAAIRNRLLCLPIAFIKCERFACSEAAGIFLYGKKRVQNGDVYILHNAIDVQRYSFNQKERLQKRNELKVKDEIVIGHVGRFVKQKNHKFLIEVFNEIEKSIPSVRLVLLGDGPLLDSIKRLCDTYHLKEKVLFMGNRSDVNILLNAMDVFLLPSLYEGLPVVGIEAQVNGLPCVFSDQITPETMIGSKNCVKRVKLNLDDWRKTCLNMCKRMEVHESEEKRKNDSLYMEKRTTYLNFSIDHEAKKLQKIIMEKC